MRLLEDMYIDNITIPNGTYLYGIVNITDERIIVNIESIRLGNNIYPVSKNVFDMDGIQGINLPENLKSEIAKKAASQSIRESNTNNTGNGIIERAAGTVLNTSKNMIANNVQEIKVTIKSNYKIYLK